MSLTKKLKQTGKALALVGGLSGMAYNSGCKATDEVTTEITSNVLGPLHPSRLLFDKTTLSNRNQQQLNDQNQNNNHNQQDNRNEKDESFEESFFVCNEIIDVDKNERVDYPYDFRGLRKGNGKFETNLSDKIAFIGRLFGIQEHSGEINFFIVDENNNLIYKTAFVASNGDLGGCTMKYAFEKDSNYSVKLFYYDAQNYKIREYNALDKNIMLSPGEYTAYWKYYGGGLNNSKSKFEKVLGKIKLQINKIIDNSSHH